MELDNNATISEIPWSLESTFGYGKGRDRLSDDIKYTFLSDGIVHKSVWWMDAWKTEFSCASLVFQE